MRRLLVLIAAFGLITALCVSAGGQGEASSGKIVELTMWHGSQGPVVNEAVVENTSIFMESHPNVHITVEALPWEGYFDKVMAAVNTNTAPDLLDAAQGQMVQFAAMGLLENVDDIYKELEQTGELDDWNMNLVAHYPYDGKMFGLPWRNEAHFTFYRTDMLEDFGVEVPDVWTWELFEQAAKVCTRDTDGDGQVDLYGCGGEAGQHMSTQQHLFNWLAQGGGGYYSEDGDLNLVTKENIDTVEFWSHIYRDYAPPDVAAWSAFESWEAMQRGNITFFFSGGWFGYGLQDLFGEENVRGTVLKGRRRITRGEGVPLVTFKTTDDVEMSKEFMKFMTEPERVLLYRKASLQFNPIQKSAFENPEFKDNQLTIDQIQEVIPYGHAMTYPSKVPVPEAGILAGGLVYGRILSQTILGTKTPREALEEAQKKGEDILNQ